MPASRPAGTRRASHVGSAGVLQGTRTFVLQDENGNIEATHSVSAGMDYAAVGPEHAWLRELGRTEYRVASDDEALHAFSQLARLEGILPALESAHAVAAALPLAARTRARGHRRDQPLRPRRQGPRDGDCRTTNVERRR